MERSKQELDDMRDQMVMQLFMNRCSTFLSSIFCDLKFSWDTSVPTACTDGDVLLMNPDWIGSLPVKTRPTILAHECWHVAYDHMGRLEEKDPDDWNRAADHAINLILEQHGYPFDGAPGLKDPRFTGMSANQIYDIIHEEGQKEKLPYGNDIRKPTDPNHAEKVASSVIKAVTIARMSGNGAGDIPDELVSMIDKLLNPKLPWYVLLRRWFNDLANQSRNWRRPNRRWEELYLPGTSENDNGLDHILWAFDASGSMSDNQLKVINTEIAGIKKTYNPKLMTMMSFDTAIRDQWVYTDEQDFDKLSFTGRGGTSMFPLWEKAKDMKVSAMVVFSDMDCTIPPKPKMPVLWVCMDSQRTAPYGKLIRVDSDTYS